MSIINSILILIQPISQNSFRKTSTTRKTSNIQTGLFAPLAPKLLFSAILLLVMQGIAWGTTEVTVLDFTGTSGNCNGDNNYALNSGSVSWTTAVPSGAIINSISYDINYGESNGGTKTLSFTLNGSATCTVSTSNGNCSSGTFSALNPADFNDLGESSGLNTLAFAKSGSNNDGYVYNVIVTVDYTICDAGPVTLPWTEDFESVGTTLTFNSDAAQINGLCNWSYSKTSQGRLQFDYDSHTGTYAAAMDASPQNNYSINYITVTLDLAQYNGATDLELSFWHEASGEENHNNDRVWIRGSNSDSWIEIYDLTLLSDVWTQVSGLDIDATLSSAGQAITSTFQIRFGQEDNYSFTNDGRIFDDILITGTLPCNVPDTPTLSSSSTTICNGESTTLNLTGALNDADHWQWYSGLCGGTKVGQGNSITVSPTSTTTYYVRGEGNSCEGNCSSITVTVDPGVPDYEATIKNTSCSTDLDGELEIRLPIPIQFNDPDYIDINSTLLSNRSEFTLEGWIKVDLADVGSRISLFGQNDAIEFGFSNASTLDCWSASGGSVSTNSYPSDNDWHHVAAVGNGTNIVLYIDGTAVATGGSSTSNYGNDANYSSKIGAGVWDPTGGYFPGSMLKVGLWSVALNATEINNLASGYYDYTGSETDLLAGYNFYEGSGTTLNSVIAGSNGTFSGTPTWNSPYTYSWTKTGDGSFSSSAKNLTNLSTGEYNMTVTFNGCTRDKSFTVISNYDSPEIVTLPTPASVCDGGSFNPTSPSINDNGSPLTAQGWEIETSSGSGSFTSLSVPYLVNVNDNGKKIRYFASNSCGLSTSNEVVLTVISDPVATILSNNGPICSGGDAEFSLSGTSGATVIYNINGGSNLITTLTGGTATITLNGVTADQTLNLVSVEIGSCSQTLNENSVVTILSAPTAILSGSTDCCAGSSADISVSFTGTAPWSVTYTDGSTPVTINGITNNPYSINVSPTSSTTYSLTAMNDATCEGSVSGSASVIVGGEILYTERNDTTICAGETATLKVNLEDNAVLFDGNNGRINISNSNDINTSVWENRTVAFWFKANDVSTRQMLYEEGAQVNGFSVYLEGGAINVHAWESNSSWGEVKTTVNPNTWCQIALVFDSNAADGEYFKGYLDGVYFGGNSNPAAVNGMNAHSGDINLGMNGQNTRFPDNSTNSSNYFYNGYIDEFKLWNRSLSSDELLAERWNVNDGSQSGLNLIVYYNFNDDSGTTVTDENGGNNGTISGGVTYETETPFTPAVSWAAGGMTGFVENVNPTSSTVYTYTLTHPFNGCESTGSINVDVNPIPSASIVSGNSVCEGDDAIFVVNGTDGAIVTYNINGGPDLNITLNGGTADITISSPAINQTLNLTAIDDGTCQQSLTESTTVIINPYPATGEIIPD